MWCGSSPVINVFDNYSVVEANCSWLFGIVFSTCMEAPEFYKLNYLSDTKLEG